MAEEIKNNNNPKKRLILIVVIVFAALAAAYFYWAGGRVSTDDAYVEGPINAITPRVTGYVTAVLVRDNESVRQEQVLVELDPTPFEVALAEARASLAEAEANLASLELGVPLEKNQTVHKVQSATAARAGMASTLEMARKQEESARQELKMAEARHRKEALDLRRIQALAAKGVVAGSALDEARTSYATTLAQMRAAGSGLETATKNLEALKSDLERLQANIHLAATGEDQALIKARQVEAGKARVELAGARLKQAELNLGYTRILAPTDGFVTKKSMEPGRMVSAGQPLMSIISLNPEDIWVTANYKETQLTRVRPGQRVTVKVDAYPDLALEGEVDSIMSGTGAVFSLFPPENASGNFVKVVQRIPVKIKLKKKDTPEKAVLRLGMSVIPTIYLDD